jgi:hypothetical protein
LNITTVQLSPWTPSRDEIGIGSVVFTATDGASSITNTLMVTVLDAPAAVTGLSASSDGNQITATWQAPAVGGAGPISYEVRACYRTILRAPDGLAAICEPIGTFADIIATFPARTSNPTNDPPGTYFELLVTPVDSVGVNGPSTLFLMP